MYDEEYYEPQDEPYTNKYTKNPKMAKNNNSNATKNSIKYYSNNNFNNNAQKILTIIKIALTLKIMNIIGTLLIRIITHTLIIIIPQAQIIDSKTI